MADLPDALKITFVIPYFYPAWEFGGQPRSAYELAKALVQQGHQVKVLTTDSGGKSRLNEIPQDGRRDVEGIQVIYYPNLSNRLAYRHRLFVPARMFGALESEIRGSDVVHIHELRSTVTVIAYRAIRRLPIPYVVSGHGGLRRLGRSAAKAVYDNLWGFSILRHAGAVIAISPVEEADAASMGVEPGRIRRLPNVVTDDGYRTLPRSGAFRKRWLITDDKVILFLGRLHHLKGADLLIRAFGRMDPAKTRARLVIAGPDDGQERELRQLVTELKLTSHVTFTGFLSAESKNEALVDARVVVVPSRSEVFAITAVEALLCGVPVLLSSVCGLHPLPKPDGSVLFFQTEDISDLQAKLATMIQDNRYSEAAHHAADFVRRNFGSDQVGSEAAKIYRDVIAANANITR